MAETEDLKSFQYRFESDWGHHLYVKYGAQQPNTPALDFQCIHKCIHNLEGFKVGYKPLPSAEAL